jgi:hypothetical protein
VEYPERQPIEDDALFATVTCEASYIGSSWEPRPTLAVTAQRSNRLALLEVEPFLRDELLPHLPDRRRRPGSLSVSSPENLSIHTEF